MLSLFRRRDHMAIFAFVVATLALVCLVRGPRGSIAAQTAPPSMEGRWTGMLGGTAGLHIELIIARLGDGSLDGHLNSVDQGSILRMTAIRLADGKVHFEVPDVGGVYDGTIDAAGSRITGTWQQTGGPKQPLNFTRATETAPQAPQTASDSAEPPLTAPLDVRVPKPPQPFAADGMMHLAYELHVGNYDDSDCTLTKAPGASAVSGVLAVSTSLLNTQRCPAMRRRSSPRLRRSTGNAGARDSRSVASAGLTVTAR